MTALRPKPFDRPQIRFITFPHHEKTAKAYSQQEIVGALFPPAAWACLSGAVSDPAQQRMTGMAKILALSLLVARAVGVRRFKRDDFLRAIATTGLSNGTRPAPCYRVTVTPWHETA